MQSPLIRPLTATTTLLCGVAALGLVARLQAHPTRRSAPPAEPAAAAPSLPRRSNAADVQRGGSALRTGAPATDRAAPQRSNRAPTRLAPSAPRRAVPSAPPERWIPCGGTRVLGPVAKSDAPRPALVTVQALCVARAD